MTLRARRLRERITIEAKNLVDNGKGGRRTPDGEPEWKPALPHPVAAEIIPLRGDEALSRAILKTVQLYRVTVRHRDGITTANRVRWGSVVMNIKSAARSVDRRSIVMTCESGVPT